MFNTAVPVRLARSHQFFRLKGYARMVARVLWRKGIVQRFTEELLLDLLQQRGLFTGRAGLGEWPEMLSEFLRTGFLVHEEGELVLPILSADVARDGQVDTTKGPQNPRGYNLKKAFEVHLRRAAAAGDPRAVAATYDGDDPAQIEYAATVEAELRAAYAATYDQRARGPRNRAAVPAPEQGSVPAPTAPPVPGGTAPVPFLPPSVSGSERPSNSSPSPSDTHSGIPDEPNAPDVDARGPSGGVPVPVPVPPAGTGTGTDPPGGDRRTAARPPAVATFGDSNAELDRLARLALAALREGAPDAFSDVCTKAERRGFARLLKEAPFELDRLALVAAHWASEAGVIRVVFSRDAAVAAGRQRVTVGLLLGQWKDGEGYEGRWLRTAIVEAEEWDRRERAVARTAADTQASVAAGRRELVRPSRAPPAGHPGPVKAETPASVEVMRTITASARRGGSG